MTHVRVDVRLTTVFFKIFFIVLRNTFLTSCIALVKHGIRYERGISEQTGKPERKAEQSAVLKDSCLVLLCQPDVPTLSRRLRKCQTAPVPECLVTSCRPFWPRISFRDDIPHLMTSHILPWRNIVLTDITYLAVTTCPPYWLHTDFRGDMSSLLNSQILPQRYIVLDDLT